MLGIYVRTSREDTENSIEQQKKAGMAFAKNNKMNFEIYEDEGKSGYKIEDDADLFKNRPALTKLLTDIKTKKIDTIWVWEHSRLSRNQYASAIIFRSFEKSGIKVFVKDSLYDLKDKNTKLMRNILDAMAEYER
jgi:DNA invertase Pin-like site-specific DNA recombinase